ncbi:MAG: ABC transporter substrate-binding protein [Armatimonadetes bacterium]|nr:ABC transporter substrate-binding protein [Armatimonadota bacterium]
MLELSIACGTTDRLLPLRDGRVRPEGVTLHFTENRGRDIFWRMLRHKDFDVAEMSLSSYTLAVAAGMRDFVAIPVFPSRLFRHGHIFVNSDAGIESPQDLKGKAIGTPEYQVTAGVFMRGLLSDEYGVTAEDVQWVTAAEELIPIDLPPRIRLRRVESQAVLGRMLETGEIAAMAAISPPEPFLRGAPSVRRLLGNLQQLEEDYFRRTRIFPIMHTVVVRREIYDRHPWVTRDLYDAFLEAKRVCLQSLRALNTLPYTMPFLPHYLEHQRRMFGEDPWPYGVEQNLPTLTAFRRYLTEQGLVNRAPEIEELFAANCLSEADPADRKQA